MAEILTIKKSYRAIKMQLFELKKIEPETQGLCGNCDNVPPVGYYIPLFNEWFCKECFYECIKSLLFDSDDMILDRKRFKRMVDRLKASGLTTKEPKILTYPYQGGIEEIEIEGEEALIFGL